MTIPPRFVPTLTEVVQGTAGPEVQAGFGNAPQADAMQREMVQRILMRVDVTLERRLREAVGRLVLEQIQNLTPMLREQIEITVAETVLQALAQEEQSAPGDKEQ